MLGYECFESYIYVIVLEVHFVVALYPSNGKLRTFSELLM